MKSEEGNTNEWLKNAKERMQDLAENAMIEAWEYSAKSLGKEVAKYHQWDYYFGSLECSNSMLDFEARASAIELIDKFWKDVDPAILEADEVEHLEELVEQYEELAKRTRKRIEEIKSNK